MNIIADFEKVSFQIFKESCEKLNLYLSTDEIKNVYDKIKIPKRATKGSAGYDFYSPFEISIKENNSFVFPTGIRCKMSEGWVLTLYPRSGFGFKTGMSLANTVGIIDQDYYYSDNEGHILVKILNDSCIGKELCIKSGEAFCQGIFLPFGIAENDNTNQSRNGGFGSTNISEKAENIK